MAESDEDIIAEAKSRFTRARDYEANATARGDEDEKFGNGDSDNLYQWPQSVQDDRKDKPSLTINKTRQHCLQIINDMRQNKPGIQIRPVGNGATFDAAQVYEGVVRHIEYISNAQQAYDTAAYGQVFRGIGYFRIITDFVNDDTFDQDIKIVRVANPKTVLLDCDIKEYDGSDAQWGFVFRDMTRDDAMAEGLIEKEETFTAGFDGEGNGWDDKDHVRVAEYFRVGKKTDELIELPPEFQQQFGRSTIRLSELPPDIRKTVPKDARRRKVSVNEVEWFKIIGDKIKDRRPWLGKYIPIVRVIGEETIFDGTLDRKGHVRALKDPQKMYNYNSSAAIEYGALQSKSPYIAEAAAIEGFETYWNTANVVNHAVLIWNAYDAEGRALPKPERQQPPAAAPVFIEGMKIAQEELMLASGQYQAVMGQQSNETSGKAINARQRQGDNATYHYIDHQASAIRYCGRILIDLIPKIYDTERVIHIIGRDGSRQMVQIDPDAKDAHAQQQDPDEDDYDPQKIAAIFNPMVGQYDIEADVGPSYGTARQEAFNAFSQIIQNNHDLVHVVGDLMFKNADFPGADEIAERLHAMVPQAALGGPSKEMQEMQQHMQQAAQAGQQQIEALSHDRQKLAEELREMKGKLSDRAEGSRLDWYRAETDRMKALAAADPAAMRPIIRELVSEALGTPAMPVMAAHAAADMAMQAQPDPALAPSQGQSVGTPETEEQAPEALPPEAMQGGINGPQ